MNPKLAGIAVAALILLIFAPRFVKQIDPGHVGVATIFGSVNETPYREGLHFPVNPFYTWHTYDTRQKSWKESSQVPTQDQLQTKVDVSVQYRINGNNAPEILAETGSAQDVIAVFMVPKLRSLIREQGKTIPNAEDFFKEETQDNLQEALLVGLQEYLAPKGLIIDAILVRDINLPEVLTRAIEQKKEREQAVERQKAELERFRTEQMQQVAQAEAGRKAAEEQSKQKRILADARAYEIREINKAVASNPAYIQLQSLEALKAMASDPATKLFFLNSDSPQPLPLMNLGDVTTTNPR